MEYKELSNLYIDLSEEILKDINFDSSSKDNQNQLLFISCIENSLDCDANHIYEIFKNDLEPIEDLNFKSKWKRLMSVRTIENIVCSEFDEDGLMSLLQDSKMRVISVPDQNIISSNKSNDLKKFSLILNKYKTFNELLRKILDEC